MQGCDRNTTHHPKPQIQSQITPSDTRHAPNYSIGTTRIDKSAQRSHTTTIHKEHKTNHSTYTYGLFFFFEGRARDAPTLEKTILMPIPIRQDHNLNTKAPLGLESEGLPELAIRQRWRRNWNGRRRYGEKWNIDWRCIEGLPELAIRQGWQGRRWRWNGRRRYGEKWNIDWRCMWRRGMKGVLGWWRRWRGHGGGSGGG